MSDDEKLIVTLERGGRVIRCELDAEDVELLLESCVPATLFDASMAVMEDDDDDA